MKKKIQSFSLFSDRSLILLISVVTLLLQLISFVTTWNGSKIYLENIFPFASLFFAVAIQATAYFFSNSLRNRVNPLKILALTIALCCSTYYSYIGIYNSVNSPVSHLRECYTKISDDLQNRLDTESAARTAQAKKELGDAYACIIAEYTMLINTLENTAACRLALSEIDTSRTNSMRAPSKSSYENYEDYVAAYNAYIAGISSSNKTETDAAQTLTLTSYGFASMEELNTTEQQTNATLQVLLATFSDYASVSDAESTDTTANLTDIVTAHYSAIYKSTEDAILGIAPSPEADRQISCFFQAAKLCGYEGNSALSYCRNLEICANATASPLLADYRSLAAALSGGHVTDENIMALKSSMDSEILTAILTLNTLLPEETQLSSDASLYHITDLYLVPIAALKKTDTRMTAIFCLLVAALVDLLSVLFAVSLKCKTPLWEKHLLGRIPFTDLEPQIFAALPANQNGADALYQFMANFSPSPLTECDGYMMVANMDDLADYKVLAASLCQLNLAKAIPAGFPESEKELLLLKARFAFWANHFISESRKETAYV